MLLRFEGGVVVRSHLGLDGRWSVGPFIAPRPGGADAFAAGTGGPWLVLRAGDVVAVQWNGPVLEIARRPLRRLGPDVLGDAFDAGSSRAGSRPRARGHSARCSSTSGSSQASGTGG